MSETRESLLDFFSEEEYVRACRHEAGHALVAILFKRPVDYVKINKLKEFPGTTHIAGTSLDGSAHTAIAGHVSAFLFRKNFDCDLHTLMDELPKELYKNDADYQSFQASCYYFNLGEANVVEQVYNILMASKKLLVALEMALEERSCLNKDELDAVLQNKT